MRPVARDNASRKVESACLLMTPPAQAKAKPVKPPPPRKALTNCVPPSDTRPSQPNQPPAAIQSDKQICLLPGSARRTKSSNRSVRSLHAPTSSRALRLCQPAGLPVIASETAQSNLKTNCNSSRVLHAPESFQHNDLPVPCHP